VGTIPSPVIKSDLRALLRDGARKTRRQGQPTLVSISDETEPLDAIDLYERAGLKVSDRFFWSHPDEGLTLVGLGIAQALDAVEGSRFRQIGTSWQHLTDGAIVEAPCGLPGLGPLLFGGFAFDPQRPHSGLWQGYPDGRMVLPSAMLTLRDGAAWLTCNVIVGPDSDPDADIAATVALYEKLAMQTLPRRDYMPGWVRTHVQELPSAAEWKGQVSSTTRDIEEAKLEKVVLARALRLEASAPFDTAQALERLSSNYPDCFIFALARGEHCFLGATPERLAKVHEGEISAMGLAGSTRRGATPAEDSELGERLLDSVKDRHEHAIVVQALLDALGDVCDTLQVPPMPLLLKLKNVQHLHTPLTGTLRRGITLLDVVERLHPTPAVGGHPRGVALALIREREGFDRGWYAGPIGWIDGEGNGEMAVAIRSSLVHQNEAVLFAGCGIVAGSDPEHEYAESCTKLRPMLLALTGE
jgi:isochorismate synthase